MAAFHSIIYGRFWVITEDERGEYIDPDFCDPDEEALTPGEMELIFENCFQ